MSEAFSSVERGSAPEETGAGPGGSAPLPWHIKLLGVAFLLYVILRLIQMAGWLVRWLGGA